MGFLDLFKKEDIVIRNDVLIKVNGKMQRVEIPNGVIAVKEGVFRKCNEIKSILLPASIKKIEANEFKGCPIEEATIPIMAIGCFNKAILKTIEINAGEHINFEKFYGCKKLSKIKTDKKISNYTSIDGSLYTKNKKTLVYYPAGKKEESFPVPNIVNKIEDGAFYENTKLKTVTISDGVNKIGKFAFMDCKNLTKVIIPKSVTEIGRETFSGCKKLTIYCEANKKPDKWDIDWNCSNCTVVWNSKKPGIALDDETKKVEKDFNETYNVVEKNVTYELINGQAKVIDARRDIRNIKISPLIEHCGKSYIVSSIGNGVFEGHNYLNKIEVPGSVSVLGDYAFDRCYSLETVVLGEGVKALNNGVFSCCRQLKKIFIPNSVNTVGRSSFLGCSQLAEVYFSGSVDEWAQITFHRGNLSPLNGATLFLNKKPVKILDFNNALKINDYAFSGCKVEEIIVRDKTKEIGCSAFWECKELVSVDIKNEGVEKIGSDAFRNCKSLESVNIGDNVSNIAEGVFNGCFSLLNIKVDEFNKNYTTIDGNLYTKDLKTLIKYATGKRDNLFVIPDTVTRIANNAFEGCQFLSEIIIPNSVTHIGAKVFDECPMLTLYFEANNPPLSHSDRPIVCGYKYKK